MGRVGGGAARLLLYVVLWHIHEIYWLKEPIMYTTVIFINNNNNNNIYFLYSAYKSLDTISERFTICTGTIRCRQASSPASSQSLLLLAVFFLVYSSRWSLAGAYCCIHQTGGWTLAYTVATLPGHNCLQLTPIEFQDRGLNPRPHEPVDSKVNCFNH